MAKTNDELKTTKQLNSNEKQSPKDSETIPTKDCTKRKYLIPGITLAFSLIALILSLFTMHSTTEKQTAIQNEKNFLLSKINHLKKTQKTIQEKILDNINSIQQTESSLQTKLDSINKELQQSISQKQYQKQDWLLLKARYCLELAQIDVHWSDHYNASIALLQQADSLLQELNSPKIFEIRQIIAKEIAQLKAIPKLDVTGLLSQLDAAKASVNALTIQLSDTNSISNENSPSNTQQNAENSSWRKQFQNSVNLLEKLVVIRRNEEPIQPLLSPLYEALLKESIIIHLNEAQWAILNNNPEIYQLVLKQATKNLAKTFNPQAAITVALLKQLNELQNVQLNVEKPKIGLALPELNQLIDDKDGMSKQENIPEQGAK